MLSIEDMRRDRLQKTLKHLGIDDSNYKVLKLLPLVYVAWSSGSISAHAEAIARTTAEAMDVPTSVTAEEERALAEIARELDVDEGESWGALVRELQAG